MTWLTLNILWTKHGDATLLQRRCLLSVEVPVTKAARAAANMTSAEMDALLTLPMLEADGQARDTAYTVRMVERFDKLTEQVVLTKAIPQALRQIEMIKRLQDAKAEEAKCVDARRAAEIKAWATAHGSARLCEQIKQGLPGWPLYLHERMAKDWPGQEPELDNDGEHGDVLINPTEEQLMLARQVAECAVVLGLMGDGDVNMDLVFAHVKIVPIDLETSDEYDQRRHSGDYNEPEKKVYVTFSGYRPGSDVFGEKTIRFLCEQRERAEDNDQTNRKA